MVRYGLLSLRLVNTWLGAKNQSYRLVCLMDFLRRQAKRGSDAAAQIEAQSNNGGEDDEELEAESLPKIDINTLKNEILTDGMEVSLVNYNAAVYLPN